MTQNLGQILRAAGIGRNRPRVAARVDQATRVKVTGPRPCRNHNRCGGYTPTSAEAFCPGCYEALRRERHSGEAPAEKPGRKAHRRDW